MLFACYSTLLCELAGVGEWNWKRDDGPVKESGCTFWEYIWKKSQKSSILQENSCGNTALNKEKRYFRKKIQFIPPFSHSKQGTKREFSHICSFEVCKYMDSMKFRRKWMTKLKKYHIVPQYPIFETTIARQVWFALNDRIFQWKWIILKEISWYDSSIHHPPRALSPASLT